MLLGILRGIAGAWSVAVRSACAHSAAASGELLLSAASALLICASSWGSQNSAQFAFPGESGRNDWQAKLVWMIAAGDGYEGPSAG